MTPKLPPVSTNSPIAVIMEEEGTVLSTGLEALATLPSLPCPT